MWPKRPPPSVLVVGSAHLDVFGDFSDSTTVDKPGHVSFSIGGTAFNIASNLSLNGHRAFLYTYLDRSSFISRAIMHQARVNGIRTKYVFRQRVLCGVDVAPGGFVAHRNARTKNLVAAVTATSLDQSDFCDDPREASRMQHAVSNSSVIIVDCNLTAPTLRFVIETANERKKSIVVCGVSQSKLSRYFDVKPSQTTGIDILISNVAEFEYCCRCCGVDFAPLKSAMAGGGLERDIKALCERLHTRFIVVTSPASYALLASSGKAQVYKPSILRDDEVVSWTGAGDALAAAVVDSMLAAPQGGPVDLVGGPAAQRMEAAVPKYVRRVARCAGATPGADIRFDANEGTEGLTGAARMLSQVRETMIEILAEKTLVAVILVALLLVVTWAEPKLEPRLQRLLSHEATAGAPPRPHQTTAEGEKARLDPDE